MTIAISVLLILSISINIILVWYVRQLLTKIYVASEHASNIFTRFDAFREHLKQIYELELFYGDRNLREVIDHTKDILDFLKKYNAIYSFTQPELEEMLKEEDATEDGEEDKEKVTQIFYEASRKRNS